MNSKCLPSLTGITENAECTDFDLILGVKRVVLFGAIISSHSKTINAKLVSFLNLYTKRSHQKALQF